MVGRVNRISVDVATGNSRGWFAAHPAILPDSLHRMMTPTHALKVPGIVRGAAPVPADDMIYSIGFAIAHSGFVPV